MDQVQPAARHRTHAPDITRVLRDLGLEENHVEHAGGLDSLIRFTASRITLIELGRLSTARIRMATPASKSGDKVVVLVDDEFSYIDLLQQLLSDQLSCPVHGFTRPADALRAIPNLNVGIIITDYQMPEINGLQFLAAVQKINPTIPAVMITAYNLSFSPRELAAVPSLKTVVRKPFKWSALAEEISRHWPEVSQPKLQSANPFGHA
jgi:two-component system chemotaxis response regulator CheY